MIEAKPELNIIVCVRRVPETESRIKISSDKKSVDTSDIEFVINPYDEYAIEQAAQLKEKQGGEVTAIVVGPEKSTAVIQKILALGADKAVHLKITNSSPYDSTSIARMLAEELKHHQFDLLLFGKKGVDDDNQQVGAMVAEILGIPCITQIVKLEILDKKIISHREVEGGILVVETEMPVAFTAEKDLTVPRYASLRELVAARKKPIIVKDAQPPQPVLETVLVELPPPRPSGRIIGKGVEAVPILVKLLHEEAKVI